jgi:flagellar biosynthesis protein FlhG
MAKVITIVSGKGGTGKTTIVANMAASLANNKNKVLIFDADVSLANMDLSFGIKSKYNIVDFIKGKVGIKELVTKLSNNIYLIPSSSGTLASLSISPAERRGLIDSIEALSSNFDYLLIDSASGISNGIMDIMPNNGEVAVVLNNDILSLTDSYATIKTISRIKRKKDFYVIGNKMNNREYLLLTRKLKLATTNFCGDANIIPAGNIENDDRFRDSTNKQIPLSLRDKGVGDLFYKITNSIMYDNNNNKSVIWGNM